MNKYVRRFCLEMPARGKHILTSGYLFTANVSSSKYRRICRKVRPINFSNRKTKFHRFIISMSIRKFSYGDENKQLKSLKNADTAVRSPREKSNFSKRQKMVEFAVYCLRNREHGNINEILKTYNS